MKPVYDSIRDLICPKMVPKLAHQVGEQETDISKAISSTVASLLGLMLKKGDSMEMKRILLEAGNLDILSDLDSICEEKPTAGQRKIGDDFLEYLLGDEAADFANPMAERTGISKVAANRVIAVVSPLVAGYLGARLVEDGRNIPQLIGDIRKEKNRFSSLIPVGVVKAFDMSYVLKDRSASEVEAVVAKTKKKNGSWWLWLLLIGILLFLIFLWLES